MSGNTLDRYTDRYAARTSTLAVSEVRALFAAATWHRKPIITPDGRVCFLETNVAPGMTETSMTPMAVRAAGLGLGELCLDFVRRAMARGQR